MRKRTERRVFLLETKDYGWEIIDPIHPDLIPAPFEEEVFKHGEHDQQTHGSWANGELSDEQKGVVSAWTSLSNKSSWRQIANDLSEGKTPNASEDDIKTVKTLVDAIKQNGVIPAEALGRAELLTTGLRWQGALPKVGDSLKNELSSATLDERTSERFSQYSDFGGSKGKPVIFHYGFQTKGLDVNRAGADAFADEQEWLVSGTFKITDKYSENGITHLNLKPIDSVKKHQEHDQSTHGNWATGNFNEETEYDAALEVYSERYGVDKDGKIVGVEQFEHDAIDSYSQEGYKNINSFLRNPRGFESSYEIEFLQQKVDGLDSLIENAPNMFGDKTLYRVVDNYVLAKLSEGDIMIEKGFLSTSRMDLTKDTNTRSSLGDMVETPDTVAIILPSPNKSGKGIAVDIYRTAVVDVSPVSDREKEVLLPRNTPLQFIGYKRDVGSEAQVAIFQRVDK